ncbi:hypothetical protein BJ981_001568 [Sphaerisporangium krabiense]|uniref:Uncharacterized protein n=1 Tax=Sphaerisporangium krabiense TaxID=763782 RepID=A0A7W9DPA7_9ACTN|nr:hypothetical protein [Sphaerisporangium krabiense]
MTLGNGRCPRIADPVHRDGSHHRRLAAVAARRRDQVA